MVKVLKFGGTSVGSAANMRKVAEIIRSEGSTVTVLSAMSGTTNALVRINGNALIKDAEAVKKDIELIRNKYKQCIDELFPEDRAEASGMLARTLDIIGCEAAAYTEGISDRIILAQGELLTSAIFHLFLLRSGIDARLLNAPDYVFKNGEGFVDSGILQRRLSELETGPGIYYITQGFICTGPDGLLDNLGRGGSDYSAALFGGAMDASQVQVWTDIDGMHNNDPRFVDKTYPIPQMSFDEAAELAYFGAKILHPATIQPCKDKGIPVFLKNTMDPDAPGTRISQTEDESSVFHAVAAKDGITVIRIYSTRMLMAYGFLRKVFEIFERYRTPIDMITTSEVAVSLTIDSDCQLEGITRELSSLGNIEIEKNNSIVCVVGRLDHSEHGVASCVLRAVEGIPLKMISYGASHRSIAMLVDTDNKCEILNCLNRSLFPAVYA